MNIPTNNITFVPNALSYNDYYPFGMLVPNRNYQSPSYRYGFQNQEKDDEIKGAGNSLNFGGRTIYDSRASRFFSIDPAYKKFPWYSSYLFAGNTPIMAGDVNGLYPIVIGGKIVGYVIEPGQGPTQIAKDINNPKTQEIYGYCLEKPVTWDKVVSDNIHYYAKAGNWEENTNLMDENNQIYRNLNSNAGDELKLQLDEEPDIIENVINTNPGVLKNTKSLGGYTMLDGIKDALSLYFKKNTNQPKVIYNESGGGYTYWRTNAMGEDDEIREVGGKNVESIDGDFLDYFTPFGSRKTPNIYRTNIRNNKVINVLNSSSDLINGIDKLRGIQKPDDTTFYNCLYCEKQVFFKNDTVYHTKKDANDKIKTEKKNALPRK